METITWFIFGVVILHGILAGSSFDVTLIKLPTRKRIGPVAYAHFARANDLGNGLIVYPILGISALVSVFGITIFAFITLQREIILNLLYTACGLTVAHSLCTVKAAPIMLGIKNATNNEASLRLKLKRFTFWHAWRAIFQLFTFIILLVVLINIF